jgi:uncharacterized membrane protein YebE (DUF533 family)
MENGMFDPERLLGQMIGGALGGAFGGRRGRRTSGFSTGDIAGKAQLGVGLLGIAMAAWEHYSAQRPGAGPAAGSTPPPPPRQSATSASGIASPPPPPPPPPADPRVRDMTLMVQAMIAAAAADGRIDDEERNGVLARAESAGLSASTRAFLQRELESPSGVEAIVAAARPEIAGDLYAASAFAISIDTDAERAYLDRLAAGLGLSPQARATIHQQLGLA